GADVKRELERRAPRVGRRLGLERHIDRRPARREAVEDELRRRFEESGVEADGLERDRPRASPLRAELSAARLEMRGPHPGRAGGRLNPAVRLEMCQPGQDLKLVDATPPRLLIPGD